LYANEGDALKAFLGWYMTMMSMVAAPGATFAGEAAASACGANDSACQIVAGGIAGGVYGFAKGGLTTAASRISAAAASSLAQSGADTTISWAKLLTSRAAAGLENQADDGAASLAGGACSFGPATAVATPFGTVAIASIKAGDKVTAANPDTGAVAEHTVTNLDEHVDPEIEHLRIDGETIETTPNHRFLTDHGWVEAAALYPGTKITKLDGTTGSVDGYSIEVRPVIMYDLTVSDVHTFAVGEGQWVVHNAGPCDILQTPPVSDRSLANLVDNLYKGTTNPNRVGNGTTMDAVRNELLTGQPTGGAFHSVKAQETMNGLTNWLSRNPNASYGDRLIAQSLVDELGSLFR
jgi:hypothetical protein